MTFVFFLRQNFLTGSILSFDYQHRDNENTLIDTDLKDESIKFDLNVQDCDNYLHSWGYSVIERPESEAMSNRYCRFFSKEKNTGDMISTGN